jgi:hypothetical protein
MLKQRSIVAVVAALGLATCVAPVSAQMNPIIMAGPQNNAMGQIMALRSRQLQQQFDRRSVPETQSQTLTSQPQTSQMLGPLVIPSDPAVTRQTHDLYIGELARNGSAEPTAVDRTLGNIRATFARMVQPYGLKGDALDDVLAAHMIVMWMAANRQSAVPTPAQAQAVRRQMSNVFASATGRIANAAERQSLAEYVMYETCMTVLVRQEIKSRPELDQKLSDAVNARMTKQGYPLRELRLTDDGLVKG